MEFKISPKTALTLLTERMKYELKLRIRIGEVDSSLDLNDLTYSELLRIAETASLDLVGLMPLEMFSQKSDLCRLVTKTMRMLGRVYGIYEFEEYTERKALALLRPIFKAYKIAQNGEKFLLN